MAEENEVLESWEELDDNEVLSKKLKDIKMKEKSEQRSSGPISVVQEEGGRTQYTPQVRILKRDVDPNPNPNLQKYVKTRHYEVKGESVRFEYLRAQTAPQKSLQQREAEYKEARLRILGEGYAPGGGDSNSTENANENNSNSNANTDSTDNSRPFKLIQHTEETKAQKVQILREPRGPDGSAGFDQQR